MLRATVETDRRWARCLVNINPEVYIVDQKDVRMPDHSVIEAVSHGQCRVRRVVPKEMAPEVIVELMRNWARHGGFIKTFEDSMYEIRN